MAQFSIPGVAIRGISACVPPAVDENSKLNIYEDSAEVEKVIATTGVERKHVLTDGITASDLCLTAAKRLLHDLGWESESIDALVYVTQTPDYNNQPTSFVMHDKLGLPEDCMCVDLYHGCPGWVIGLSQVCSLLSASHLRRALLLDGDAITKMNYPLDRESRPLFGDCGTATAVEYDPSNGGGNINFVIGSRSKDGASLIHEIGGYRKPFTPETFNKEYRMLQGEGLPDADADVMDGMSVFSFGITVPPKSIKKLCESFGIDLNDVDKVVLHQANEFMLKKIVKKLKVDSDKVPMSLRDYGNTTSASIPLTIVSQCGKEYASQKLRTVCCGFGTGLSWGTACFETDHIVCPEVLIYDNSNK